MMYLGVDGGGTKTALCLVDEGGHVAAQTQAPSCYYFKEGIELAGRVLKEGIEEVCAQASVVPADIRYAFFGLPTYGEVSATYPLSMRCRERSSVTAAMPATTTRSAGGRLLGGVDGINVVSGTGSITTVRGLGGARESGVGGDLFGDEGSAYWISIKGLNAFTHERRTLAGRAPSRSLAHSPGTGC